MLFIQTTVGTIHLFIHSILIQFVRVNENCVQYIIASYIVEIYHCLDGLSFEFEKVRSFRRRI